MNILHAIRKAALTSEEKRIVGECMPRNDERASLFHGLLLNLSRTTRWGYFEDAEPAESARCKLAPLIGLG